MTIKLAWPPPACQTPGLMAEFSQNVFRWAEETFLTMTITESLPGYEVVSARHQDVLLTEHVLLLLGLHDVLLLQTLEGVGHARLLATLDQLHPAKPAHTQRGDHLQVVQLHVQLLLRHLDVLHHLLAVLHDVAVLLVPELREVADQLEEGLPVQGEALGRLAGGHHVGRPGVRGQQGLECGVKSLTDRFLIFQRRTGSETVSDGGGIVCNSDVFDYQSDYHLPRVKTNKPVRRGWLSAQLCFWFISNLFIRPQPVTKETQDFLLQF